MRRVTFANFVIQTITAFCMMCLAHQMASAQCTPRWLYSADHVMPGISQDALGNGGTVRAMVAWDPDGEGPMGQWLVFAGEFTRAGSLTTTSIAAWDGFTWHALGSGTNAGGSVYSLAVWNGQLVVGGTFTSMNGVTVSNIAKYDGTTWSRFNAGTAADTNGSVRAMTVYRGELIIGGTFTQIGQGNNSNLGSRIARWTGSSWQTVGSGVTSGSVFALTTYGDDLIVGGSFTAAGGGSASKIARWNRDSGIWSPINNGTNGDVLALRVFDGQLIVGGVFTAVSGSAVPAGRVASWNATSGWAAMGSGFNNDVLVLEVHDNELHAGGAFTAGFTDATARLGVARWHGSTWSQRNEGMLNGGPVDSLYSWNTQLFAGGGFTFDGNRNVCKGFAVLEEQNYGWVPVSNSFQHTITAMVEFRGDLYTSGFIANAETGPARSLARWNGQTWDAPTNINLSERVNSMIVFEDELIVTGGFTVANGGPGNRIAAWNGTSWRQLGDGFNADGRALAIYQGQLIAGGAFVTSGATQVNCIAKWNGVSWDALGTGMSQPDSTSLRVDALTVHNNELIAGGHFIRAGGIVVNHVAKWNGSSWASIGGGFNGGSGFRTVFALAVYNNQLVATGNELVASPSTSGALFNIASWNGTSWQNLGGGLTGLAPNGGSGGRTLLARDGFLYAGGVFTGAGGAANSAHLARWNGSAWSSLGSGVSRISYTDVRFLYPYNGELLVAGGFMAAGGQPSGFFARWTNTNIPWAGPLDATNQHLCEGESAQFHVIPASGYTTTITWQQETAPNSNTYTDLVDGSAPGAPSTTLSGTASSTLTITNAAFPLNALRYRAVVANACGQDIHEAGQLFVTSHPVIESEPASLTLCVGEPVEFSVSVSDPAATYQWRFQGVDIAPDLNPSAVTATLSLPSTTLEDAGEYDCVITNSCSFTSTTQAASLSFCACLACGADFNQDGGIDGSDVSDFFIAWETGSCDADVNNDGGIDGSDVNDFFIAWEAGGC